MSTNFDVVVIGAGPAGYVAAIRAAQNGLTTACIDNWKNFDDSPAFGGTCLNAGCIPSKALLESSELFHRAQHEFAVHGIGVSSPTIDVKTMQSRKAAIVKQFTGGIVQLFKANGVTGLFGRGRFDAPGKVDYTTHTGDTKTLHCKHVVIASGSVPIELKSMPFDRTTIVDSWDALEFDEVPQRLGVIGGGVIGLELGSVWKRLGAEVTVFEAMDDFLALADRQLAKDALRQFKRQGMDIKLGAMVKGARVDNGVATLAWDDKTGGGSAEFDKVIVAVGRRPNSANVLGQDTGVRVDDRGYIIVDHECRTGVPNVWAIGDVVRGPMLAHKGSEEGVAVADRIAGQYAHMNYDVIPSVIYTAPEMAWVGKTEEQLKEAGVKYKRGTFGFAANGRAKALEQATGMVKILAAQEDDEILGVHIIGPMAGELIGEVVLAMEFSASAEDIQRTIHAHPSLSEAIHEAALSVDNRAIHGINRENR